MKFRNEVYALWNSLWTAAQHEIVGGHAHTIDLARQNSKRKKAEEPDFIATLVLESIPNIARAWTPILSSVGVSISVTTVFCHQRPLVDHGLSTKNPEIGDLLIVHQHRPAQGLTRRRALLLQAKMASGLSAAIDSSDHQLALYTNWPVFSFKRPTLPGIRDVHPKQAHAGAKYLLMDSGWKVDPHVNITSRIGLTPYITADSRSQLVADRNLASELVRLVSLEAGKAFFGERAASRRQDWTRVIWDLLRMSVKSRFRRKNIGFTGRPRVAGAQLRFIDGLGFGYKSAGASVSLLSFLIGDEEAKKVMASATDGEDPIDERSLPEDEGGVSTILIETSDKDAA